MARVARVGLDVDVVARRAVRPVEELDDAEAVVDGLEQGAVALLAPGQRVGRLRCSVMSRTTPEKRTGRPPRRARSRPARQPAHLAGVGAADAILHVAPDLPGARVAASSQEARPPAGRGLEVLRPGAVPHRHAEQAAELGRRCRMFVRDRRWRTRRRRPPPGRAAAPPRLRAGPRPARCSAVRSRTILRKPRCTSSPRAAASSRRWPRSARRPPQVPALVAGPAVASACASPSDRPSAGPRA